LTWAYAILARTAQAANRRQAKAIPSEYAINQPSHLPPVDSDVATQDDARAVIDTIRSLPKRQREMVTLYFLVRVVSMADNRRHGGLVRRRLRVRVSGQRLMELVFTLPNDMPVAGKTR
jgi:hypothetical protein